MSFPNMPSSNSLADQSQSNDNDAYRQSPHNIDAEEALLGAILVNNDAYDRVNIFLRAEHFYTAVHGRIYDAAVMLINRGQIATPVTLKAYFDQDEGLDEVGGSQYLAKLAAGAVTIINAADYGQAIYEAAQRRQLIEIGEDMVNTAYAATIEEPPRRQIEDAEQKLYGLAEKGRYEGGFRTFGESLAEAIDVAAAAYKRDGGLAGISSGLVDLDNKLGGLHKSDLLIIAARPSMGKSALAVNIAVNVAKAYRREVDETGKTVVVDGAPVAFFTLEMSSEQVASRVLSEQARISSEKIRRGILDENEFRSLVEASQTLETLPLYIDDTPALTISAMTTRARRLKRQYGIGLVIVDYLQLLRGSEKNKEARVQEVTEITQGLKALAKELSLPVIALAQLSRAVEQRDDKRPQLSDLRESGSIEQDADAVMFIYREEYYLARTEPREGTPEHAEWQQRMEEVYGMAEIIIGKQRHGPVGTVKLSFQGEFTKFDNLVKEDHLPDRY